MARRVREPKEEAPDPRPTGAPGPMVVVEDGIRLSESRLWRLQRRFFESQDPRAWSKGRVPSYITSNAFMAQRVARVALAFLDDAAAGRLGPIDAAKPMDIIELGAGSGRFAFGFLRELEARLDAASRKGIRARYVVTDLAPSVQAVRQHPRLARFVKKGLLDFAALDADAPGDVRLLESGDVLRPSKDANPLVAVANYFFDGIPTDVFEVREGQLFESHLRLTAPKGADANDPATLPKFATTWEPAPAREPVYGDAQLDAIVAQLSNRLADSHFLMPVAGLRLVRHLRALGGGRLLLLAADRGHAHEEALLGLDPPHLERHGSFSIDVNFHALALDASATKGVAMLPPHRPAHLVTAAFLWGADGARTRTQEAFEESLAIGGPEDLFVLKKALERQKDRLDIERALAWLRVSAWDPEVFLHAHGAIMAGLDAAPPTTRLDVLDAARRAREAHFPTGGERDVPYALGEVFQALDALPEAEACFAESLAEQGPTADTLHRLAVLASALHRMPEALRRIEEALALDASHEPARAMRIALEADLRRRHRD